MINNIHFAYFGRLPKSDITVTNRPYECYYCAKFFVIKRTFESHIKNCSGKPGIVYNFNIQNIVTYEDNLKYIGDVPFSVYADFETTAPNSDFTSPENNTMFAVSYALVFAWHPKLNLPRQCVVRGFNHSIEQLADMSYLTAEQLALKKQTTAEQFRDGVIEVNKKKNKNAIAELFNIELKFACHILQKWFNFKIKSNNLAVPEFKRLAFNRENPITRESRCTICHFLLNVSPKGLSFSENDMSYLDFLIRKEHAFISNIFDEKDLKKSINISTLEKYQAAMELFIHLVRVAEHEIKTVESYDMIYDEKLEQFLKEYAPAYERDLPGLLEDIKSFEIRNNKSKVSKFTIQMYACFYDMLMDFPRCKFEQLKTITTQGMFTNFCKVINTKTHLHHSHITGEIIGHTHDFCNWKVRENTFEIPLIGHNFLGFDIFYMVKGYRSSCWGTKEFEMGGINLTNVNYANIRNQIKITDILKYYQTTLAGLASTTDDKEKESVRKMIEQFLKDHIYFGNVWQSLEKKDKETILNLIAEGKEVMPYEKIVTINSLCEAPEKEFYEYTEFYSGLKQANVSTLEYENCRYLFKTLKMRNLGDLNDLYNMQDTILLCEIIENRFQIMQEKFGFNPRKINSASTLSGCVQRDVSKVILALPSNYEHAEVFEKSLIGRFSCVNTRIGFDSEVLLL